MARNMCRTFGNTIIFFAKTRRAVLKIRLFFEWLKTKINFVPMRGWESYDMNKDCAR